MGMKFQGTIVSIGDDIAQLKAIGCLTGFNYSENEPTNIDDTCADATEFKKTLTGLKEPSTVELDLILDHANAGYVEALTAKEAGTEKQFSIAYSDSTHQKFKGVVKTISKSGTVDDTWKSTMSIVVNGSLETYTPA